MSGEDDPIKRAKAYAEEKVSKLLPGEDDFEIDTNHPGIPFYEVCQTHAVYPDLIRWVMSEYAHLMDKGQGAIISNDEQDALLSAARVYRRKGVADEHILEFPYTTEDGEQRHH